MLYRSRKQRHHRSPASHPVRGGPPSSSLAAEVDGQDWGSQDSREARLKRGLESALDRWRSTRVLAIAAVLLGVVLGGLLIHLSLSAVSAGVGWVDLATSLPGAHLPRSRAVGRVDAPVQIVVYSDFQCSHCEAMHRELEGELVRRYVATGQAHLEMRQFPILGEESNRAAEAALAAADQGRFWEYRDALFRAWAVSGKSAYSDEGLLAIAEKAGLDVKAFAASLASGAHRAEVEAEKQQGKNLGIDGVPAVFVNGKRVGPGPPQVYIQAIEEVLSR